jgi:universal stress protein A
MLTMKRIVVPVDFSADSAWGIEEAADLARRNQGALFLVHVVCATSSADRDAFPVDPLYALPHHELVEDSERRLRGLARGVPVADVAIRVGDPSDEIVAYARSVKADLILVATHHRGLRRMLLGSTASAIVRRAECPVLVVRHGAKTAGRAMATRGGDQRMEEA